MRYCEYSDVYIYTKEDEQSLNEILEDLCQKYDCNKVSVRIDFEDNIIPLGRAGLYYRTTKTIVLRVNGHHPEIVKRNLYHEFRHHWQWEYYPEICQWYQDNYNEYRSEGRNNVLEQDAYCFGNSLGNNNREDLLQNFVIPEATS